MTAFLHRAHPSKLVGHFQMINDLPGDFEEKLKTFGSPSTTIFANKALIDYLMNVLNGQCDDIKKKYVLTMLSTLICTFDDYINTSIFLENFEDQITSHPLGHYIFYQHFMFGYNELDLKTDGNIALRHRRLMIESVYLDCNKNIEPRVRSFDIGSMIRWENEIFFRPSKELGETFEKLVTYEIEMGLLDREQIDGNLKQEMDAVDAILLFHRDSLN